MQTPKQMAGSQRRSLKAMRDRVQRMADDWDEVDMCMLDILNDLVNDFDQVIEKFETEAQA
jgi:predicted transcriptional regulator